MNKTKIEWTDMSWNPVTGCKHGCPYCYAERVAKRFGGYSLRAGDFRHEPLEGETCVLDMPLEVERSFNKMSKAPYPYDFAPTFHRYRLDEPALKTKPQTIFVCSMADLFGAWVPTSWIVEVLDACQRAPQHRYLFLTKNPKRYIELDHLALLPRQDNFWYGSTVTKGEDPATWMRDIDCHWFVSIEPLLGPVNLTAGTGPMPEWVIIGAETGNRAEKVEPEYEWIRQIVSDCRTFGIPVFMKDSLQGLWPHGLLTEFPWEVRYEG